MAEIALISSRKSKLEQLARQGDIKAGKALELSKNPNTFLSTVQIGITFTGIFAGAYGGQRLAEILNGFLSPLPFIGHFSGIISILIVVLSITYLSVIFGELVPKRIALIFPETIASLMSLPMLYLSKINFPLVKIMSVSTEKILDLFQIPKAQDQPVSEEEIKLLIREGARLGIFNLAEKDIVERTFRLADKKVSTLMTPRNDISWLEVDATEKKTSQIITSKSYSYYPVCQKSLDKIIGLVRTKELLVHYLKEENLDLKKLMRKPVFVPESMNALKVLENFKKSGIHAAVAVDEYGYTAGLVTITDLLEAIVGDIPTVDEQEEKDIIKREDGSFLVDGLLSIEEFKEYFRIRKLPEEQTGSYRSVGGLITHLLGKIGKEGDRLDIPHFNLEVMDMDGNRVDKLLVRRK